MLDISPGIFFPTDSRIVEYYPQRIFDVIEKIVCDGGSLDGYDLKQFQEHINSCAIKYDNPKYLSGDIKIVYITLIFQHNATECLNFYLSKSRLTAGYFWRTFRGTESEEQLYQVLIKHGYPIDSDWIYIHIKSPTSVENVIRWMGISHVLNNVHILHIFTEQVVKIYGLEVFVSSALRNPCKVMDDFVQEGIKSIPTERREFEVQTLIDRCLRDDDLLYTVVDNIRHEDPHKLATMYTYKDITKHPDIQHVLSLY